LAAGTRIQERGSTNEEEDVVAKHEDEADCAGDYRRANPHCGLVCLPWLQMLELDV